MHLRRYWRGVRRGLALLDNIQETFAARVGRVQDAQQWNDANENVCKLAIRQRTVVGVLGSTSAGKSSVINAMRDEERLMLTTCMRACTAVVREMPWNDSKDASRKY
jgi:predicted GTPase